MSRCALLIVKYHIDHLKRLFLLLTAFLNKLKIHITCEARKHPMKDWTAKCNRIGVPEIALLVL